MPHFARWMVRGSTSSQSTSIPAKRSSVQQMRSTTLRCASCSSGAVRRRAQIVASHPLKFAVLGSPISHSKSPALHRAAYRVLGLDWEYTSRDVASGDLAKFLTDTESQ